MSLLQITKPEKRALAIALILGVLVAIWFFKFYLMLIILSALMAYLFNPVHQWLMARGRSQGQAALLTFLTSLLAIIIPVILVGFITVLQIESLSQKLSSGDYSVDAESLSHNVLDAANDFFSSIGVSYQLTTEQVANAVTKAADSFSQAIVSGLLSSISGIFSFITTAIIYIYVFMSMLRHQRKILETLKRLNPLGDQASSLYLEKVGSMTKATVRGQFIIAFLQGTESAILLSLVGLSDLFFFFWMLLTALSVIPLGAGIVTIPLGIIMILTGNVWQGVVVITNHLLIVTNIDNVTRPKLVPPNARMDPALMILAVFSGLAYFGFIGIVLGPVIMIVLLTTLQMYMEVYEGTESIDRTKAGPQRGIMKRISRGITKRVPGRQS